MDYLIAIGLGFVALIAAFFGGRSSGKDAVKSDQQSEVLDNVSKAKSVSDAIDSASVDDLRDSLRVNK
jgi:hypothetical protein